MFFFSLSRQSAQIGWLRWGHHSMAWLVILWIRLCPADKTAGTGMSSVHGVLMSVVLSGLTLDWWTDNFVILECFAANRDTYQLKVQVWVCAEFSCTDLGPSSYCDSFRYCEIYFHLPYLSTYRPAHPWPQERTIIQSSDGSRKDKLKKGEESFSVDDYSLFKQDNKLLGSDFVVWTVASWASWSLEKKIYLDLDFTICFPSGFEIKTPVWGPSSTSLPMRIGNCRKPCAKSAPGKPWQGCGLMLLASPWVN